MSSSDFPVGSVVYFLAAKTEKVLPAQIVERIDRTSMSGIKSTYIIAVRSSGGDLKKIEVDPEKLKLFSSPDDMKNFMVSRATEAISELVKQAVSASNVFEAVVVPQPDVEVVSVDDDLSEMENWHIPAAERPIKNKKKKNKDDESSYTEVDLGDGKTARLRM